MAFTEENTPRGIEEKTPMSKLDQAIGRVSSRADEIASMVTEIGETLLGPIVEDEDREKKEAVAGIVNAFTWRCNNTDETLCAVLSQLQQIKSQLGTG